MINSTVSSPLYTIVLGPSAEKVYLYYLLFSHQTGGKKYLFIKPTSSDHRCIRIPFNWIWSLPKIMNFFWGPWSLKKKKKKKKSPTGNMVLMRRYWVYFYLHNFNLLKSLLQISLKLPRFNLFRWIVAILLLCLSCFKYKNSAQRLFLFKDITKGSHIPLL